MSPPITDTHATSGQETLSTGEDQAADDLSVIFEE